MGRPSKHEDVVKLRLTPDLVRTCIAHLKGSNSEALAKLGLLLKAALKEYENGR
jgi:hypothetical protein